MVSVEEDLEVFEGGEGVSELGGDEGVEAGEGVGGVDQLDEDGDVEEEVVAVGVSELAMGAEAEIDEEGGGAGEVGFAGLVDDGAVEGLAEVAVAGVDVEGEPMGLARDHREGPPSGWSARVWGEAAEEVGIFCGLRLGMLQARARAIPETTAAKPEKTLAAM